MFEATVLIFLGGLGLCVGSFLNVLILRFGFTESPESRSHCMACGKTINSFDLIPVVSYLLLKGRCRFCGSALTSQYPIIEAITAFLFVLSYLAIPPSLSLFSLVEFVSLLVFLTSLLGLVVYDIRHTLVPLPFVWVLFAASAVISIAKSIDAHSVSYSLDSILGGVALFAFFYSITFLSGGRGMGAGDAYVAFAAGALLGLLRGVEAVMFGVWIATLVYLFLFLLSSISPLARLLGRGQRVTIKSELPFVPFLAIGILLVLFTELSPFAFVQSLVYSL